MNATHGAEVASEIARGKAGDAEAQSAIAALLAERFPNERT